jgi:hypothetical protein
MIERKRRSYGLNLFAVGKGPQAAADAARYAAHVPLCLEWEQQSSCPAGEAEFAEAELGKGSRSFAHWLPLKPAGLWLCAAEFSDSSRATRAFKRAHELLKDASTSDDPLVAASAVVLQKRGTCYAQ